MVIGQAFNRHPLGPHVVMQRRYREKKDLGAPLRRPSLPGRGDREQTIGKTGPNERRKRSLSEAQEYEDGVPPQGVKKPSPLRPAFKHKSLKWLPDRELSGLLEKFCISFGMVVTQALVAVSTHRKHPETECILCSVNEPSIKPIVHRVRTHRHHVVASAHCLALGGFSAE